MLQSSDTNNPELQKMLSKWTNQNAPRVTSHSTRDCREEIVEIENMPNSFAHWRRMIKYEHKLVNFDS